MGEFIQKDMSGQLFKNTKATKETHPGYTGSMTVKGVKFSIAAWVKDGSKGKYFSISIKPWEDKSSRVAVAGRSSTAPKSQDEFQDDNLEDVPF